MKSVYLALLAMALLASPKSKWKWASELPMEVKNCTKLRHSQTFQRSGHHFQWTGLFTDLVAELGLPDKYSRQLLGSIDNPNRPLKSAHSGTIRYIFAKGQELFVSTDDFKHIFLAVQYRNGKLVGLVYK